VTVLDDAFDRVSALEFAPPVHFVSHAAMACEALDALGFDDVIDDWVRGFEAQLVAARAPVTPPWPADFEWRDMLGDARLLPEWLGYFERSIADDGWPAVVGVWVPRLMPGLAGALFHGVIRTSHAVRAIEGADTPARRAEVARALGNWATWCHPGQPVEQVAPVDDAPRAAALAAAGGAQCFASSPGIVELHGVTGAMAVSLLAGHVSPADGAAAVAQLRAEHEHLYQGAARTVVRDDGAVWDEATAVAAAQGHDAHQIKLVEACHRGFEITGEGAFVRAAEQVTMAWR
jgi:hypothetical protein